MALTDDLTDPRAELRDLKRRIRTLETASPLNHSSISGGTGLGVYMPAGIHLERGGSATAGAAFLDSDNGGRVGSGKSFFRSDGALSNSDGELHVAVNMTGAAHLTYEGQVRGRQGVVGPINGQQRELGAAISAADTKAGNAASAASTAQSRADSAHSLASGKASQADFIDLANDFYVQVARVDALVQKVDSMKASYELHLREFHGGWGT